MKSFLLGATLLVAGQCFSTSIPVTLVAQQKNQWCWNACATMIMQTLGTGPHPSQQAIADWAVAGYNFPNYIGHEEVADSYSKDEYGIGNPASAVTITQRGMSKVIEHYQPSLKCSVHGQLSAEDLQREVDNGRPVVARIAWYGGLLSYLFHNNNAGGHVVVVSGFDGTTMEINDPWEPNIGEFYTMPISSFQGSTAYRGTGGYHRWTNTVKIAGSLDLVFLIDSTGSMGDDIANVKSNVNTLIDSISTKFKDYRIAVVDYKDYPQYPYGDPSDYTYRVVTSFSPLNSSAAKSGINSLSAGGGADIPESVFSALDVVVTGSVIGGWRSDPVERHVFVLGDAPGHDPEPFPGGKSSSTVLAKARNPDMPINVHTLLVGSNINAENMFNTIAGATGGMALTAGSAIDVAPALNRMVDEIATNPRFPRGELANFLPSFTFDLPQGGMTPEPSSVEIQLMKFDTKTWFWKPYLTAVLGKGRASYTPKSPLPLGRYQWRVNFVTPSHSQFLPDGATFKSRGGKQFDTEWTEFERVLALPAAPSNLSPYPYSFTPSSGTVTYSWTKAPGASKHAVRIYRGGKLWKSLVVAEPAKPTSDIRTLRVTGHSRTTTYRWEVQGLNYDRPTASPSAWTP
ncbi:MAG: C39 family peptidase [Verrucomicrobiaceae bacterium]|nr:C39 family peptidase [Verrucomicrobiaceae bacterium]